MGEQIDKFKICTVIVTYNRSDLLVNTLKAVMAQTQPISQLVIVDNCSTDNTQQVLAEMGLVAAPLKDGELQNSVLDSDLKVCCSRSAENLGGSYGFYTGLKLAHEMDNDFIWMMDDDVEPDRDCLELLVSHMDKQTGVCIPNRYGNGFVDSAKTKYDLEHVFRYKLSKKKDFIPANQITADAVVVRDMPFEGPLLRSSLIDQVGLPNKDLFIIFDDTEYATRLSEVANIKFVVGARLFRQLPTKSAKKRKLNWKDYYSLRNEFWFDHTYGKTWAVRELRPRLYMLGVTVKKTLKGQSDDLAVIRRAYKDGMNERLGKTVNPGDF